MALITLFDDLPDLVLIELFTYLSSLDNLWAFTRLNNRLTALIVERGFFCHINLSSAWYRQFDTLLCLLPLDNIESLTIDINASPLQLTRWPYLPRLTKLRLKGLREPDDVLIFVLLHAATLTHLKIESEEIFVARGGAVNVPFPMTEINPLVNNIILRRLPALRVLDLGMKFHVIKWCITDVPMHLTYLRVALRYLKDVFKVICTRPLSETLRQMHVTLMGYVGDPYVYLARSKRLLPQMTQLHTFTFVKIACTCIMSVWPLIELLTSSTVMPVLRKANLMVDITVDDLAYIDQSPLFIDNRHIDVRFALILMNDQHHLELTERVPRGSQSHPRQIASGTFVISLVNGMSCFERRGRQHVWYTLPWSFTELFRMHIPDRCITQLQVWPSPMTTAIGAFRLRTLQVLDDALPAPIHSLPHLMSVDRIDTLHLSYCERQLSVPLPALRHVTLIQSPSSFPDFSFFPPSVCSIQIELRYEDHSFVTPNWCELRSLSTLPRLISLRLALFDVVTIMDDTSLQIFAEIAPMMVDFGFCFRHRYGPNDYDENYVFDSHTTFIKTLRCRILTLSNDKQPLDVVEYQGCGLIVWF